MKRTLAVIALAILTAACSREETPEPAATAAAPTAQNDNRVSVPSRGAGADPAARERERFDTRWRDLVTFRQRQADAGSQRQADPAAQRRAQSAQNIRFVRGAKQTFENASPDAINAAPVVVPITGDLKGPSVLKTQVYLDRLNFSVGVVDGRWGKNSAIALWWFQKTRGINPTGDVDEATFRALAGEAESGPVVVTHHLTSEDVKGPFVDIPEDMYDKAKLDCLCYESVSEKLAEKFHTTTDFLAVLNPGVDLGALKAGDSLNVPNVRQGSAASTPDISRIVVSLNGNTFNAYNASGNLVFHGPTTVGNEYDPSPTETLEIKSIHEDPHFHYQPKLFHEVPDDEPEANLNPGPNSPVGIVWIALSKRHYGIHGTSDPDSIGYASSHGCIRLTNWDAKHVAERVSPGIKVEFTDTRGTPPSAAAVSE